jgi:hypothetical protein
MLRSRKAVIYVDAAEEADYAGRSRADLVLFTRR